MSTMNRMANCHNQFQGDFKKVLCVCSAGLLRSPTAALVLSRDPFNFNTRASGCVSEYALMPVDEVLIEWADEIVVMERAHERAVRKMTDKKIICLNVPDKYAYRNPELMELIKKSYEAAMIMDGAVPISSEN